ncbi:peptidoglycan-binding domain-containing protein [Streptomyces violaceus]|uniref:Peptidoglycan-binding domain-containing protein n=2 Tax=Streptomyces violaceus TaxID=1936 RepID=A0ABY9UK29_STRVL|nr:peptidoglycan-binding protein [Streptomyces janthinus]WND20601.1 peptidoglycan-binding domain-containing protein [Streptomyces janthinus]
MAALALGAFVVTSAGLIAPPAAAAEPACSTNYKWASGSYNNKKTFLWVPAYPAGSGYGTLCTVSPGASGVEVRMIQDALVKCYGRSITVDGEFGPATKTALKYAQGVEDIGVDGYYGDKTRLNLKWPRRYSTNSVYTGTCMRM